MPFPQPSIRKKKPLRLGFAPIGKFVFSHEDALRQKNAIENKLKEWNVDFIGIDTVVPDGIIRDQKQAAPVIKYFKEKEVDALFLPHCNFGTEGAVGIIGREMGVPLLLWGPRDEAPLEDGSRLRDSLCGMFASSKVLRKLRVPFTYIENCGVEDKKFQEGMDLFLRAARAVKAMRKMRIAQLGVRIDHFWTTVDNESELLERFGVQLLPVDMADFLRNVKTRADKNRTLYQEELAGYSDWLDYSRVKNPEGILNGLAFRDEALDLAEAEEISGFSYKNFSSLGTELGEGLGLGESLLQEYYPAAAESDIHGAISSVLVEAASRVNQPSFFPEYTVRHPVKDNAVLLWHGTAPLSLRDPGTAKIAIHPPWILKGLPAKAMNYKLKDGPLTICRFDGDTGSYVLGTGEGVSTEGPATREFYLWMEVNDWPSWERAVIEGPYIHHCSAVYDHCSGVLREAVKYIPGLKFQNFNEVN